MGGIVGPAVPRVRDHAFRRDSGLDGGLAHHHAHDVLARAASPKRISGTAGCTAGASGCSARFCAGIEISLTWVLDHPALILILFLVTLGLNVFLIDKIPKGFFPQQDTGAMMGGMQGPQDTSFYAMEKAVQQSVEHHQGGPGRAERHGIHGRPGRHQQRHSRSSR